ncbi:MAG TPA: DUF1573 domain-containing protein [Candidatus Binatia bacterium]|nr:DUF1573 domain-containing protein [Candidatus Binatia bacterium]
MRSALAAVSLLGVVAALAGCAARQAGGGAASLGGGPRALVREPSHDFGTVEPGALVLHRFEIANVGDQPLDILSVKASCGCTASVLSDRTVYPGQSGAVELALDTSQLSGRQSKAVYVATSDPGVSEIALVLYGEVVTDVSVEPRRVFLGRIAPGDVATSVVNVVVHRDDVAITDVKSESGQVAVSVAPLDPPERGMRLVVTPRTNGEPGPFSDRVVVRTTSSRQPKIAIPVLVSVEEGALRRSASSR